ncbi:MAG: hypothetical protein H7175_15460 [Burkholderiales bacterium]|nr:hypothetical protein [Anaerolineae bacterium]
MERVNYDALEMDRDGIFLWKGKPFTGVAFEMYPNGQISAEDEMLEGIVNGFVREWYPSGERKLERFDKLSERHSWSREWFRNGILKRETTSADGFRIKETIWNEEGQIVSTYERPSTS